MVAPDVEIDDGKGTILISSEEGETDGKFYSQSSQFEIEATRMLGSWILMLRILQPWSYNVHCRLNLYTFVYFLASLENLDKNLNTFGINNGIRLKCDDFLQVYNLNINIIAM